MNVLVTLCFGIALLNITVTWARKTALPSAFGKWKLLKSPLCGSRELSAPRRHYTACSSSAKCRLNLRKRLVADLQTGPESID